MRVRTAGPGPDSPHVALLVAGLADGLVPSFVHLSMRKCLVDAVSTHTDVFMNLQLDADVKERWGIGGKWRLGQSENAGKNAADHVGVRTALAVLQPRFVTLNEPAIEGFSGPRNEFSRAQGSAMDSRCAGNAWNETGVPARLQHRYPYDRLLRIHDRYRRGMLLVELAEQRDGSRYEWVLMARPDLVFYRPFTRRLLRQDAACIFPQSHVDFFAAVARSSANAVLVDSTLSYWRCEQIRTSWNEKWLSQACAAAALEKGQCVGMGPDPNLINPEALCTGRSNTSMLHAHKDWNAKDAAIKLLRESNRSSQRACMHE